MLVKIFTFVRLKSYLQEKHSNLQNDLTFDFPVEAVWNLLQCLTTVHLSHPTMPHCNNMRTYLIAELTPTQISLDVCIYSICFTARDFAMLLREQTSTTLSLSNPVKTISPYHSLPTAEALKGKGSNGKILTSAVLPLPPKHLLCLTEKQGSVRFLSRVFQSLYSMFVWSLRWVSSNTFW